MTADCSCEKCQLACQRRAGWFAPEEIAPLAANMTSLEKSQKFPSLISSTSYQCWKDDASQETH